MYFIALSATLLVIIASVHLLAKIRNENLGIFSKLLAYFVLITAFLMLACQLYRGIDKMEHRGDHHEMMMFEGKDGNHKFYKKKFRHGKMDGEMRMECPMECCKDSAGKAHCKEMEKEVEVIIKEEKD